LSVWLGIWTDATFGGETLHQRVERCVHLLLVVPAAIDGSKNYLFDLPCRDCAEFGSSKEGLDGLNVVAGAELAPPEALSWHG
jgi:hypothetical protein